MNDGTTNFFTIIFVILFFGALLFPVYSLIYTILSFLFSYVFDNICASYYENTGELIFVHTELWSRKLSPEQELILIQKFPFYNQLSKKKQKIFASRVAKFIYKKDFEGREALLVTDEMKVLISAAAIRLTFGYRYYLLENFPLIIIYPEVYYSRSSDSYNKGETNLQGVVAFSWNDFMLGNKTNSDRINLGFHEFAHALFLNENDTMSNIPFRESHHQWRVMAHQEEMLQKIKEHEIFREYALRNELELFAVAVENFFEDPFYFKTNLPDLYTMLSKLLNQDPLAKTFVTE